MKVKILVAVYFLISSSLLQAEYLDSYVKVDQISVWVQNGDILLKTDPRPNIAGLTCTTDYWLVLDKSEPGYQSTLSMLLAAQTTQRNVHVRADDSRGEQFCYLTRVITNR